jgi:hypothetical protein
MDHDVLCAEPRGLDHGRASLFFNGIKPLLQPGFHRTARAHQDIMIGLRFKHASTAWNVAEHPYLACIKRRAEAIRLFLHGDEVLEKRRSRHSRSIKAASIQQSRQAIGKGFLL